MIFIIKCYYWQQSLWYSKSTSTMDNKKMKNILYNYLVYLQWVIAPKSTNSNAPTPYSTTMLWFKYTNRNMTSGTVLMSAQRISGITVKHLSISCSQSYSLIDGPWDHKVKSKGREISKTVIFTYLSFELTRLTSSLVLPTTDIVVVSVTEQPMYPAYYLDNPLSSYETGFGVQIHDKILKIKEELNVTCIGSFNLQNQTPVNNSRTTSTDSPKECDNSINQPITAFCYYGRA